MVLTGISTMLICRDMGAYLCKQMLMCHIFAAVMTRQLCMHSYQPPDVLVILVQASGFQTTFPGVASQFVTSHSAMQQLQEIMLQEQNLFISLMGSLWRRVSQVLMHVACTKDVE